MSDNSAKSSTLTDWAIFLVSLAACIFILATKPEWFWVTLPFVTTYLVKALRMM